MNLGWSKWKPHLAAIGSHACDLVTLLASEFHGTRMFFLVLLKLGQSFKMSPGRQLHGEVRSTTAKIVGGLSMLRSTKRRCCLRAYLLMQAYKRIWNVILEIPSQGSCIRGHWSRCRRHIHTCRSSLWTASLSANKQTQCILDLLRRWRLACMAPKWSKVSEPTLSMDRTNRNSKK